MGSVGTMGLLVQNATYAVVVPLYLIIYLSTSPLVSSRHVADFLLDSHVVTAVPVSIGLGYVVPAILMSLPAPSIVTFEQKQTFIAIWQAFPLWVASFQAVLPTFTALLLPSRAVPYKTSHASNALRQVYLMLLVLAGIGQISTLTLLATSQWFPNLFASEFRGVFNLYNVVVPVATSPSFKMSSIGSGAFMLLQYDELIGSTSMVLFTTVLYVFTAQKVGSLQNIRSLVARGLAAGILTGPLGYAVACIWARDELIAQRDEENSKKSD